MKKVFKIALIVLLVFVLALGAVAVWQWNNIKAVFMSFKYSSEEIDTLVAENEEEIDRILKSITPTEIRALTDEEMALLQSGELSEEEALKLIKGIPLAEGEIKSDSQGSDGMSGAEVSDSGSRKSGGSGADASKSGAGSGGSAAASSNNASSSGSKVDDIIARIYLLRAEYVGDLYGLESEAAAYVKSIPSKDWNVSKKLEVVDIYTGKAAALESQCDASMGSLTDELEAELKRTGGDVSVISKVKSVYASEKELKKSQLLGKYGKYL